MAAARPWCPLHLGCSGSHTEPTLMIRLYTFTISHFAEKARWSLDYKGIPYQEKRLVPGSHIPIVKRIAPSTFVPVLQDAGRIIQGSSAIIDYVDEHSPEPPLTPADPSERQRTLELEHWLDCEFGGTGSPRLLLPRTQSPAIHPVPTPSGFCSRRAYSPRTPSASGIGSKRGRRIRKLLEPLRKSWTARAT